jgi:hypothetical protein
MRITLDWLHIVALLGAVQGLVLAGVLAARRRNRTANRVLAVLLLAFTNYLVMSVYYAAGLIPVFPHLLGLSYLMPFLFGPLVYLYAVTASDRARRLTGWDALHFAPFVLALIATLPIYLMSGPEKIAFAEALRHEGDPLVLQVLNPLKLASGVIYTVITLLFLRRHRARIRDSYSSLEHVNLRWLVRLAEAAAVIWGVVVVFHFLAPPQQQQGENLVVLGIALLVYGTGYMALRQPEIFRYDTAEYPVVRAAPAALMPASQAPPRVVAAEAPADTPPGGSRYERSGLGEREAAVLKNALLAAMDQDRPWLDSELTLADLARRLSTTPHKLSEVLNSELEQSFYDFVNAYRVRYVQRRI